MLLNAPAKMIIDMLFHLLGKDAKEAAPAPPTACAQTFSPKDLALVDALREFMQPMAITDWRTSYCIITRTMVPVASSSSSSSVLRKTCAHCAAQKMAMPVCSQCKAQFYCSRRCLQHDRPRHTRMCQWFKRNNEEMQQMRKIV
ncbi:hypothetical protein BC940DRAFT_331949 [Gongronella butleri]|nr:hypothetical protein BC940DRAFT_331949 [Gongronella butleri]